MRLRSLFAATLAAGLLAGGGTAVAQTGSMDAGSLGGDTGSSAGTGSLSGGAGSSGQGSLGALEPTSYALIGDLPYGDRVTGRFPAMVEQIDAAKPAFTVHLGDIKNGSSKCTDEYFQWVHDEFEKFDAPLVYTPGDNEWTDCHRANNGAYDPLERLETLRTMYFATPGDTLGGGQLVGVKAVTPDTTPENIAWGVPGASMAAVHVVGSNDATQPWSGLGQTAPNAEQLAAQQQRMDDAIATVRFAFQAARIRGQEAVVIHQQADMFDPTYTPAWTDISAFKRYIQVILDESANFSGKVYLFDGDSHVYNEDKPLATGSPWLATYGVSGTADNLTRLTVDGSDKADVDWVEVTVTPGADEPVSWKRVPFTF